MQPTMQNKAMNCAYLARIKTGRAATMTDSDNKQRNNTT